MLWRDLQAIFVRQRANRCGLEYGTLLFQVTDQIVGDLGDFFATKDADQRIDFGTLLQQLCFLTFGETAGYDHALGLACLF